MQRLILMRHGEAEAGSPTGGDFDRKLTVAGQRQSIATAQTLCDMGVSPDHALVSSAARTQATWARLQPLWPDATATVTKVLYLAEPDQIWETIKAEGADTLMVIGHNPGLQEVAVSLLQRCGGPDSGLRQVQSGLPTAAAVVFLFDASGEPHCDGVFFP